jgi:hypothetical protein
MNLNEALEYLIEMKYVVEHQKKFKFTALFYKDLTGVAKGLISTGKVLEPNLPSIREEKFEVLKVGTYTLAEWTNLYSTFLRTCSIPEKGLGQNGDTYALNKYSEDGMKAFRLAMKSGYDYVTLIAAVKLYYTGNLRFKKAIGNYMKDGDWRTDYERVKSSFEAGTLGELIKEEAKDGSRHTNYIIG